MGIEIPELPEALEIGKGRILREGSSIAILSLGAHLQESLEAADELQTHGLSCTVADARFAKPLDEDMIRRLAREHEVLITVEEGAIGGFAAHVLQFLALEGLLDNGLKIRPMTLPDRFIAHGTPQGMYEDAGLAGVDIVNTALAALGSNSAMADLRA
jgi:1-deoxy-D-xylulose-5-phosphate synthase